VGLNEHHIRQLFARLTDIEGGIDQNTYDIINTKLEIITNSEPGDADDMGPTYDMDTDLGRLNAVLVAIFNKLQQYGNALNSVHARLGALEANVSLIASVPIRSVLFIDDLQLHTVFTQEFEAFDYHHRLDLEEKFTRGGKVESNWDIIHDNKYQHAGGLRSMFNSNFIHTRVAPGRINSALTVLRQLDWSGASVAVRLAGKGGLLPDNADFYEPSHTYQSATVVARDHPVTNDGAYHDAKLAAEVKVFNTISTVLTAGLAISAVAAAFFIAGPVAVTGANAIVKDIYVPILADLYDAISSYSAKWVTQNILVDAILNIHKLITTVPEMEFRRNDEKALKDSKGNILTIVRQTTYSENVFIGKHMGRQSAKANEAPGINGPTRSHYSNKKTTSRVHTKSSHYGVEFFGRLHYRHHSVTNVFDTHVGDQDWVNTPKYNVTVNVDINRDPTGSSAWKSGSYGNFDRAEGDAFALDGRLFAAFDYTLSQWVYYDHNGNWTPVP
jgi:hypothetical protein